jgi:hypothetical protein
MKESPVYEQITDEGRVEQGQTDVLAVLQERFGMAAVAACRDAVQRVINLDTLSRLHRLVVRCADLEQFQRGLRRR